MITGKTILCFASGYDAPPTSKHHVMGLLAEGNTVLWVNYHASRAPSVSSVDLLYVARRLAAVARPMRQVRPNLFVMTPLVVPLPAAGWARTLNRLLLTRRIRAALRRVASGPVQIWSFAPDISYLLGRFGEEKVIYYCVDDFSQFTGYNREQVLADEADLCRRADLVVTTSQVLQRAKAPLNPNTVLIPHGVDYEHFASAVRGELAAPADLAGIPHPIIGFFGLIRDWVDLPLIAELARRRGDWHFVLIGDATVDLSAYRALPNMHFLGGRSYADLPAYCGQFDVGVIPFVVNEMTRSVNPIKLREYLAAGLPVVSSPLPEVRAYEPMIHIADGADEWSAAIESALGARSQQARRQRSAAMAKESWPGRLELICRRLERGAEGQAG